MMSGGLCDRAFRHDPSCSTATRGRGIPSVNQTSTLRPARLAVAPGLCRTRRTSPRGEGRMPTVRANDIDVHYEEQGSGEPLVLITYLAANHACYVFQVEGYTKRYPCISVDSRGAGQSIFFNDTATTE